MAKLNDPGVTNIGALQHDDCIGLGRVGNSQATKTTPADLKRYMATAQDITHTALKSLALAAGLLPGQLYRITDFQSARTGIYTGTVEPLTIRAKTTSTFHPEAHSDTYPNDVITYDIGYVTDGYTKGRIVYRRDPARNVSADCDFRNFWTLLWEPAPADGRFFLAADPGGGATSQLVPMFNATSWNAGDVEDITLKSNGPWEYTAAFGGYAKKVVVEPANDAAIFLQRVSDAHIGSCSTVISTGQFMAIRVGNNSGVTCIDDKTIESSIFGEGTQCRFTGAIAGCIVMPGYNNETTYLLAGDHAGEIIGFDAGAAQLPDGLDALLDGSRVTSAHWHHNIIKKLQVTDDGNGQPQLVFEGSIQGTPEGSAPVNGVLYVVGLYVDQLTGTAITSVYQDGNINGIALPAPFAAQVGKICVTYDAGDTYTYLDPLSGMSIISDSDLTSFDGGAWHFRRVVSVDAAQWQNLANVMGNSLPAFIDTYHRHAKALIAPVGQVLLEASAYPGTPENNRWYVTGINTDSYDWSGTEANVTVGFDVNNNAISYTGSPWEGLEAGAFAITADGGTTWHFEAIPDGAILNVGSYDQFIKWNSTTWRGMSLLAGPAGLADAPSDGKFYARRNGAWEEIAGY